MVLVDNSKNENKAVVLAETAQYGSRPTEAVSILATGTITGTPKLTMSLDGVNFVPLLNDDGEQVALTVSVPVYLRRANVWVKVDLTGVTSSDLKVEIM
jgi:hypothetical protein